MELSQLLVGSLLDMSPDSGKLSSKSEWSFAVFRRKFVNRMQSGRTPVTLNSNNTGVLHANDLAARPVDWRQFTDFEKMEQ